MKQGVLQRVLPVIALVAAAMAAVPAAAQLTVVSFGGSYQEAQSKAVFQPAAKAMGITVKEETYTGIGDLRLKAKAGAVTWDLVTSGAGGSARAGSEGILEKIDYKMVDVSTFVPGTYSCLLYTSDAAESDLV